MTTECDCAKRARENLIHKLRAVERELKFAIFLSSPKTLALQADRQRLMRDLEQTSPPRNTENRP